MKKILSIITILLLSIILTSCDLSFIDYQRTYEITFETNGGTSINHIYVDQSFSAEDLALYETTKDGYVFDGWYIDPTFEQTLGDIKESLTVYAKWLELFTITWVNEDDSVLATSHVVEGETPVYEGTIPTKSYDGTYSYTFDTWSPSLVAATEDQTYRATFTQTYDITSFDDAEIDDVFGFNLSDYIPVIKTHNYEVIDASTSSAYFLYINMNDWTQTEADLYETELNSLLLYNSSNESWMVGNISLSLELLFTSSTYEMVLTASKTETETTWLDVIDLLDRTFTYDSFLDILTTMQNLSHIGMFEDNNGISITALTDFYNSQSAVDSYISALNNLGWYYHSAQSSLYGEDVYIYDITETTAAAVYITYTQTQVQLHFWVFDNTTTTDELTTFVNQKSITTFEEVKFGKSGLPSVGTYHVLLIPIEIKGSPFPADYMTKLELAFNGDAASTGWQSVSSFYKASSFGDLDITFDIQMKFTTTYDKSYYEGYGTDGDQYAMVEAINALNPTIDYSDYDYNNDGVIDSIYFIYSVQYDYDTDPWWAWVFDASYGVADSINNVDGKSLEYYMWASYYFLLDPIGLNNLNANAETYIHETGHLLGYIDLYPYETYTYGPVGGFDMMDWNVGDHGPANKLLFGWLEPLVATSGSYTVTIDSYATDTDGQNSVILIPYNSNDLADGDAFDEYLLIMFYTPQGLYDGHLSLSYVPDNAGIIVYHVDARLYSRSTFWGDYFQYNNEGLSDFFTEILEADKNDTFPSTRSRDYFSDSDMLRSGTLDLSTDYSWHQGGAINVSIEVASAITNTSPTVTLVINIG